MIFGISFWNVGAVLVCLPPSLNVHYVLIHYATHSTQIGKSSTHQFCLSYSWDSRDVCRFIYSSCKSRYQTIQSYIPWEHYKHVIWVIYIQNMYLTSSTVSNENFGRFCCSNKCGYPWWQTNYCCYLMIAIPIQLASSFLLRWRHFSSPDSEAAAQLCSY